MQVLKMRLSVRSLMYMAALTAAFLSLYKMGVRDGRNVHVTSPRERALRFTLSLPSFSDEQANAVFRIAELSEDHLPGHLSRPRSVTVTRLNQEGWQVIFKDRKTGEQSNGVINTGAESLKEFSGLIHGN